MAILLYTLLIVFIALDIFLITKSFEYMYAAHILKQPPLLASNNTLRKLTLEQILTHYSNAKNICEVGSGFGGLARMVAHKTDAKVYALENMPFSAFISKTLDIISFTRNNKTILCDAFKYLDKTNKKFDIAIAYLGPELTTKLLNHKNKFDVLISLDFKIPHLKPKYVVSMGYGNTIYKHKKYPHKIFIYEFK